MTESVACGVVPIIKPPGITSHDVVSICRKLLRCKRVGHTGTLDPAAVGVVVVCFGEATKIVQFLEPLRKAYRAEMTLGWSTDTQDSTGNMIDQSQGFTVSIDQVDEVLRKFIGEINQIPPMVSAVKMGGRPLYELARQGQTVERQPRQVSVYELSRYHPFEDGSVGPLTYGSKLILDVVCSSGTYVRTICHDVGERLGTYAHLSYLVRIAASGYSLDDAVSLEELEAYLSAGERSPEGGPIFPMDHALRHIPVFLAEAHEDNQVANGVVPEGLTRRILSSVAHSPSDDDSTDSTVRVHKSDGSLAAVCRVAPGEPRPVSVVRGFSSCGREG